MSDLGLPILLLGIIAAVAAAVAAWAALRLRSDQGSAADAATRMETVLREEAAQTRRENADLGARQRQELGGTLTQFSHSLAAQNEALGKLLAAQLENFARSLDAITQRLDERLQAMLADTRLGRQESAQALGQFGAALALRVTELRGAVETHLKELQTDNTAKLEEMRRTVDEKLHATLEQRFDQSFKLVAERLEQVYRGLGEMQVLASGVGDLNRMLTGVKTRGIWGEVQLGNLLEQVLTRQQYQSNVATKRGSRERVEYAICLPGRGAANENVWLPIDAKFPREDYERLLAAHDRTDAAGVEDAGKQLEARIKAEARSIRDKYIDPPHTTDFALMFLPTEGLYAEVLRRPGLSEHLQRDCRVTIAGPTTLTAILNSLQMGFRTLAIERRSSEVWKVLGAVKTEFGKFGDVLKKVKDKLDEASSHIEQSGVRTRAIERQLREVEALPEPDAAALATSSALADDGTPLPPPGG